MTSANAPRPVAVPGPHGSSWALRRSFRPVSDLSAATGFGRRPHAGAWAPRLIRGAADAERDDVLDRRVPITLEKESGGWCSSAARSPTWAAGGLAGVVSASLRRALSTVRLVIEVCEYDPSWPRRFELLRDEYATALAAAGVPVVAIEHVGSTAVPGLAAKPIIDCDIVVEAEHVGAASSVLEDLGFEPRGELGIPSRWAFWEPERLIGTNTYVVVAGSLALRNHLAVRDVLRADASLREAYGSRKKLVGATAADIYEYGAGKNDIVQRILAAAGMSAMELESINSNQVPVTPRRR